MISGLSHLVLFDILVAVQSCWTQGKQGRPNWGHYWLIGSRLILGLPLGFTDHTKQGGVASVGLPRLLHMGGGVMETH